MSLAPSLLKILLVAPVAGAVAVAGVAPSSNIGYCLPTTGAVSTPYANEPTLNVITGPTAEPQFQAYVVIAGNVPTLRVSLTIYPALPDGGGDSAGLAPTLVWGGGTSPLVGLVSINGLPPALAGAGTFQSTVGRGEVVLAGLAPSLQLPAANETLKLPGRAEVAVYGYEPALLTALLIAVDAAAQPLTVTGLAPSLSLKYGWQTVELTGAAVWTDVPSA